MIDAWPTPSPKEPASSGMSSSDEFTGDVGAVEAISSSISTHLVHFRGRPARLATVLRKRVGGDDAQEGCTAATAPTGSLIALVGSVASSVNAPTDA